ncbi:hypothetical protein BAE44_0005993, partial [Dichanthelium oligosanthes]
LWLSRTADPRLAFPARADTVTQAFFTASIKCEVGDGRSILFWSDPWLEGACLASLLPDLVEVVPTRRRIRRTVTSALPLHVWYSDLLGPLTVPVLAQFLQLTQILQTVVLDPSRPDRVLWKWCPTGQYSCSLAYLAFFLGQTTLARAKELWKVKAPNEFRLFFWLALQNRCWTSGRLFRHGLRTDASRALCYQLDESVDHLLLHCIYSREVWFTVLCRSGWQRLTPSPPDSLSTWWLHSRKLVVKAHRKAFDSVCLLLTRLLWLERNDRVFRNIIRLPGPFVAAALEQVGLWLRVGFLVRSSLFGE